MKQKKRTKKFKAMFDKDLKHTCAEANCFEIFPDGKMGYCTRMKKIIAADTQGCKKIR